MREGDLKAAEEVLQRMQEAGVRPNHVSYGTLMEACAKAGDAGRCAKVASSAMAAGIK